ncbi:bacteriophage CI repressor [Enterocloster clostridioformis]|uniref:helix-turn-helix domain-containing protein n=1 Tax=Enterocloster clostridioformis TaxID=1531 RepID=UPI00156D410B|nr:helix-turn-helix domain-containing protein [Enterocloster clostridioformis]NSJ39385.1 bacteriophage CI repressor [Enterocloster clostridioformis]
MSVTDKVRAAINLSGKSNTELAAYLGISNQSLSNKLSRGSFSAEDLIKIADFSGSTLLFEFAENQKIKLLKEDIR